MSGKDLGAANSTLRNTKLDFSADRRFGAVNRPCGLRVCTARKPSRGQTLGSTGSSTDCVVEFRRGRGGDHGTAAGGTCESKC